MSEEKKKTSGTTIGAGWYKMSENGTEYVSIAINPEILPLNITEKHSLVLFIIDEDKRKSENSPMYRLVLSKRGE